MKIYILPIKSYFDSAGATFYLSWNFFNPPLTDVSRPKMLNFWKYLVRNGCLHRYGSCSNRRWLNFNFVWCSDVGYCQIITACGFGFIGDSPIQVTIVPLTVRTVKRIVIWPFISKPESVNRICRLKPTSPIYLYRVRFKLSLSTHPIRPGTTEKG